MGPPSIEIRGLSKRYAVEDGVGTYRTLREALRPDRLRVSPRSEAPREVWALRDLDLDVAAGEAVGVIGANGVGKSTLLKLISRITEPTSGVVRTRGRVGALLEVGTGFHPELSGAENVFLNGAILGMPRKEIARSFAEIVEFAGVESFLNTPVKHYSSGMYLRLAFSVAAHLRSPILVVDEVLAVGDAQFRQKCLDRMEGLGAEGRTVLFVSHDLGAIRRLCPRVLWLDKGTLEVDGSADDAIGAYLASGVPTTSTLERQPDPDRAVDVISVRVEQGGHRAGEPLYRDRRLDISVGCRFTGDAAPVDIVVYLVNSQGVRVLEEALSDQHDLIAAPSTPWEAGATLSIPPLLPADDYVLGLRVSSYYEQFLQYEDLLRFRLLPRHDDTQESLVRRRVVQPQVEWRTHPLTDDRS